MSQNYFEGYEEDETTDNHERRIVRCKSCNARIVFLHTGSGKAIPVDADTVKASDTLFDPSGDQVSHFATCPNADKHRRKKT